jgi:hypothetical protein
MRSVLALSPDGDDPTPLAKGCHPAFYIGAASQLCDRAYHGGTMTLDL